MNTFCNIQYTVTFVITSQSQEGISSVIGSYNDGVFRCSFRYSQVRPDPNNRVKRQGTSRPMIDLHQHRHLMLGDGPAYGGIWLTSAEKKIFIFESKIFPLYIDFHKHRRHFPWSFFCPFPDILAMHTENPLVTAEMVNLQSTDIIGDVARYPLVKVHGKFQDDCNIQYFTVHDYRYIAWCFSLSLWNRITNTLKWMIS